MTSDEKHTLPSYNGEQLRELHESNPLEFQRYATEAIKAACIGKTPEHTRKLQQMQWVIDAQLRKGKTPVEKMRIMEDIFYTKIYEPDGLLEQLQVSLRGFVDAVKGNSTGPSRPHLRIVHNHARSR